MDPPDLPDWLLSFESMSPSQRYVKLPKARDVVPDWKTMSILKQHYYPERCKVTRQGVRFQNTWYQDEALADIVGEYVSILCHTFTAPYAPGSLTIIHNGKAICEAYPARKNGINEAFPSSSVSTSEMISASPSSGK